MPVILGVLSPGAAPPALAFRMPNFSAIACRPYLSAGAARTSGEEDHSAILRRDRRSRDFAVHHLKLDKKRKSGERRPARHSPGRRRAGGILPKCTTVSPHRGFAGNSVV